MSEGVQTVVDQAVSDRFTNVLAKGDAIISRYPPRGNLRVDVDNMPFAEWRSQSLALLESVFERDHPYTSEFGEHTRSPSLGLVEYGMGILRAAAADVDSGRIWTLKERAHAELFDDFLDMADYFIADGGYKDAAAMIAGGALEAHLRKLCQRRGIAIQTHGRRKKASAMNDELAKLPAYNQIEWRSVQGWLDLRNDAAHGGFSNYTGQQVEQMIDGIRGFIGRHPA